MSIVSEAFELVREVCANVLKDELETTMRMMGVTDLSQVHPGMLNTRAVDHLIPDGEEHPYAKWRPKAKI
jgi:L-lactate dehydrogenase (cytochrome)